MPALCSSSFAPPRPHPSLILLLVHRFFYIRVETSRQSATTSTSGREEGVARSEDLGKEACCLQWSGRLLIVSALLQRASNSLEELRSSYPGVSPRAARRVLLPVSPRRTLHWMIRPDTSVCCFAGQPEKSRRRVLGPFLLLRCAVHSPLWKAFACEEVRIPMSVIGRAQLTSFWGSYSRQLIATSSYLDHLTIRSSTDTYVPRMSDPVIPRTRRNCSRQQLP